MDRVLRLEAGTARIEVRPADGGRLGSVTVDGRELLVTEGQGPMAWGSYPMAPWAGRVRDGRFSFAGQAYQLHLGMPPHAIHGVVYDRPWRIDDDCTISIDLDERWPFGGRATQRFALDQDGLEISLEIEADQPMPVTIGWHPWFRRELEPGGHPAALRFDPGTMLQRDEAWIPDGRMVAPPPGPWDDAFTDVHGDPVIEWPGRLRLALSSSCRWWVVYTMPAHAICVEPQSGPPDALNLAPVSPDLGPAIVVPGAPLVHTMRWRWTRLG